MKHQQDGGFRFWESRTSFWLRHCLVRFARGRSVRRMARPWPKLVAYPADVIGREMAVTGLYELPGLQAVEHLCRAGVIDCAAPALFMDVGANIGTYSITLSPLFSEVKAFEPHPKTTRILALNIDLSQAGNVEAVNAALSDRNGRAKLGGNSDDNLGAASKQECSREGVDSYEVETVRGDDWLAGRDSLARLAFVKVDVEGHEHSVLEGLRAALERDNPVVAFESLGGAGAESVRRMLSDIGYCEFFAVDFSVRSRSVLWRVLVMTIAGAESVLRPVSSLSRGGYSLVFALNHAHVERARSSGVIQ